jgi:L-asparaginase II
MGKYADKKEVVAACMESPFYFAVPLKERLELMRQLQQPSFYSTLRQDFLFWIKTGRLIS